MDASQIQSSIRRLFEEGSRIVLWRDEDGEFDEILPTLELDDIEVREVCKTPALELKSDIELAPSDVQFLLYEKGNIPDQEQDWLLDIRFYAAPFAADRSTMILKELGLVEQSLRDHIAARAKFFASKERLSKAARFIQLGDGPEAIDRALMATLLKADQTDTFSILRYLLHTLDPDDLEIPSPAWRDFEKYDLAESFWSQMAQVFGYDESEPSLKSLLIRMLVSDFAHGLDCDCPSALVHLVLPKSGAANAVVCVGRWRDSAQLHPSYDALSGAIAESVKVSHHLKGIRIESLRDARTFLVTEQFVAGGLRDRILETVDALNLESVKEIVSRRQNGHWANTNLPSSPAAPRETLSGVYDALDAAASFIDLRNEHSAGFAASDSKALFQTYTSDLYKFDQLYRVFCEAADIAKAKGWDILKQLRTCIEDIYGNWYIAGLATHWGDQLEGSDLLKAWKLEGVSSQYNFFKEYVRPRLDEGDDRRVYVIISDAFRYEAAQELTTELNGRYRFAATLRSQLGVLPSYTGLGMASLLPHKEISYNETGTVMVDGKSSSGLANRQKALAAVDGTAILADAFMSMNKSQGREFIKPHRVIYIYHNQIDQTADTGNEEKTFQSVRTTINELGDLVSRIINSLNGNYIVLTADHGFLYQESPPTESDKNKIAAKPPGTVISKKRYLLGKNLPDHSGAYHSTTAATANARGEMEFWVPRGANRFHFIGGSRFVHGGAMPQEIVVPVIQVAQLKGRSAEKTRTRSVGISVLSGNLRITTSRYRFRLIQTEAVTERIRPLNAKIAIFDGDEPVTNVEVLTFASESSDMNEWQQEVWLTLGNQSFDKKKDYSLIVRNAETSVEEARMNVIIDLAFDNDF